MNIKTFTFDENACWTQIIPPDWNVAGTLIFVFGASDFINDNSALKNLCAEFSEAKIIGCSTAGEILGESINDGGLSGAAIKFEKSCLETAYTSVSDPNKSFDAGAEIARQLNKPNLRGIFVLSDGLNVNGSHLVAG